MEVALLYGLIFACALGALQGCVALVLGSSRRERGRAKERILRAGRARGPEAGQGIVADASQTPLARWARALPRRRDLELFLARAGMAEAIVPFLCSVLGLSLGGFALGSWLLESALLGSGLLALGVLPFGFVGLRRRRRLQQFEAQLPEALDLMCRALRAGISLEFGLRSVGEELADPIGSEFAQVADEVNLGLDIRAALANLAQRVNTTDMPFFVNAITIQRETGGNLAEILDNLATIIRDRLKFYGKVRTLVAQVNLTANLLALMPVAFAVGMSVVSPGYLDPLFAPEGRVFLYGGALMLPMGWLACKRIASIDL